MGLGSSVGKWERTEDHESGNCKAQPAACQTQNPAFENCPTGNEDLIVGEVKSAAKKLVANGYALVVEESLEDVIRTSYHSLQSGTWSRVYKVDQQVMLHQLRKRNWRGAACPYRKLVRPWHSPRQAVKEGISLEVTNSSYYYFSWCVIWILPWK